MEALPRDIVRVLRVFEDVFSERVWDWVQVLVVGAILTPGQRTVAAVLRVMGLSGERQYQNYHRVLNRARWSSREPSRRLLSVLVRVFVPADAPVLVGLDETIERRRGAKIAAKGIYRDPVRSSKGHFVKASGLRWISMQLLAAIPWAGRVWGLAFLTVLAPSERYNLARGRRHKTLPEWGRQMIRQLRRWLPDRVLVVVADSTYAVLELLADAARLPQPVTVVTRLRLDAALYDPAPPRGPGTMGRPRLKGDRHRHLVSPWSADRQLALGAAARSAGAVRSASPPLHRPDRRPGPDRRLVRHALAARSDLPRGPGPPRRRDSAPMVGPGPPPHHPGPARTLLARDPVRPSSAPRPAPARASGRLVREDGPDLLGYARLRSPAPLAHHRFLTVPASRRRHRNPPRPLRPPDRCSGVRRLSSRSRWTKPSLADN